MGVPIKLSIAENDGIVKEEDFMPQLNKGGKYVFGWSLIRSGGMLQFPSMAISEYHLNETNTVIAFTGSKSTGGFCVTTEKLLTGSKLQKILDAVPELISHETDAGHFLPFKGRFYTWFPLSSNGMIALPEETMNFLKLTSGHKLMSIRSSDIAFTMGAKGPLIEKGLKYSGNIETF